MKLIVKITILLLAFSGSVDAAKIIDFQPNCKPELIENTDLIEPLQSANGVVSAQTTEKMRRSMLLDLVELAKQKNAEAIILNDVKVLLPESKKTGKSAITQFRLKMTAEFINLCPEDKTLSQKVTPFNFEGIRQMELGGLTFKQQQIVIREPGTQQKDIPALQSAKISLEKGVYGAMLVATQEHIVDTFGYPTAEFKLDSTTHLFAYGRSHWFYFKNDQLIKISSKNLHLNRNLINLVPFDDRFDDAKWQLYQRFTKNSKEAELEVSKHKTSNAAGHLLRPVWRKNNAMENVLDGFNYSMTSFIEPILTFSPQTIDYAWLLAFLDKDPDARQAELDRLTDNAIGKIYVDRVTISYVIDEYMLLNLVNSKLREIVIGDSLFKSSDVFKIAKNAASTEKPRLNRQPQWQLGDIKQESSFESIQNMSPDNALQTDDTLTINHPNYNLKYQFYEQKNQLRLFKLRFSVF